MSVSVMSLAHRNRRSTKMERIVRDSAQHTADAFRKMRIPAARITPPAATFGGMGALIVVAVMNIIVSTFEYVKSRLAAD
jgi:hypothetical protein